MAKNKLLPILLIVAVALLVGPSILQQLRIVQCDPLLEACYQTITTSAVVPSGTTVVTVPVTLTGGPYTYPTFVTFPTNSYGNPTSVSSTTTQTSSTTTSTTAPNQGSASSTTTSSTPSLQNLESSLTRMYGGVPFWFLAILVILTLYLLYRLLSK